MILLTGQYSCSTAYVLTAPRFTWDGVPAPLFPGWLSGDLLRWTEN